MGIEGLHPVIRPYLHASNLTEFKGKKVAVDASAWLHRGLFSCGPELFKQQQDPAGAHPPAWVRNGVDPPYVDFCLKLSSMLKEKGITPVLVFDGASAPMKASERARRQERRAAATLRAQGFLDREGSNPPQYSKEAQLAFGQAVEVTPTMARELQRALRRERIEFVVAPYEADSQLAFLSRTGQVAAVVTEDSDLVAFGCPVMLFKVDRGGSGLKLDTEQLMNGGLNLDVDTEEELFKAMNEALNFAGFSQAQVQLTCALAGCDYIDSLPGIGFKTAFKLVQEHKTVPAVVAALRKKFAPKPASKKASKSGSRSSKASSSTQASDEQEGGEGASQATGGGAGAGKKPKAPVEVPQDYQQQLERVMFTWTHSTVYDANKPPAKEGERSGGLVYMSELPEITPGDLDFLGPLYPDDVARDVAKGLREPRPPYALLPPLAVVTSVAQFYKDRKGQGHHNRGGAGRGVTLPARGQGAPSTSAAVTAAPPTMGPLASLLKHAKDRELRLKAKEKEKENAFLMPSFVTPVASKAAAAPPLSPSRAVQFTSPSLKTQLAGGVLTSPPRSRPRPKAVEEEVEEEEGDERPRRDKTPVLVAAWGGATPVKRTPARSPIVRGALKALQQDAAPQSPLDIVMVGEEVGPGEAKPQQLKRPSQGTAGPNAKKLKGQNSKKGGAPPPAGQRSLLTFFGQTQTKKDTVTTAAK